MFTLHPFLPGDYVVPHDPALEGRFGVGVVTSCHRQGDQWYALVNFNIDVMRDWWEGKMYNADAPTFTFESLRRATVDEIALCALAKVGDGTTADR